MLYQLSYSPKELDDLAAVSARYSSAVRRKRTFTRSQRRWQECSEKNVRPHPEQGAGGRSVRDYFFAGAAGAAAGSFLAWATSASILVTTPAPTVLPPSRIAKRRPSSQAIGDTSSTSILMLSPGITISVPAGSVVVPVTSVVRK